MVVFQINVERSDKSGFVFSESDPATPAVDLSGADDFSGDRSKVATQGNAFGA